MRTLIWLLVPAAVACQPHASTAPEPRASTAAAADKSPPAAPSIAATAKVGTAPGHVGAGTPLTPAAGHELAAFAEGCFWGSENTFRHVKGVTATAVGYTGGHTDMPTYEDVSSHTTGHAETVLVEYDPKVVTYADLLHVFWDSHDPTTKDRQGPDIGSNYRSAIFTFSDAQAAAARASEADEQTRQTRPITTEIRPIGRFYKAEEYHQQYDEKSGVESCPLPVRAHDT
ncbi:MAG TPA: peptide-methionine (S)-S-oxide reductase MsrA [Polyangiaceae bacterium]|nr:peptide-methionine (S)-S-oxide reductase MsrA [Polyangiaceae bacterium]